MEKHLHWRNLLTTSNNMEIKIHIVPWWCLHHIAHYESKNLLSFDYVCWGWQLTSCSISPEKIACSSHLQLKTPKNSPLLVLEGSMACSQSTNHIGALKYMWSHHLCTLSTSIIWQIGPKKCCITSVVVVLWG
jgi:hypothetical protein